ncbi:elongator complex protein 5 [Leptidea sinapis]|uniref:elongator complex protein 5 n=1 Tax=Leptidea sinapis TaxID=189913 RepID=UPI0021215FFC|nr:elongator complex protein 5 [Leptidea sinapis]
MTLFKLQTSACILVEDHLSNNCLPLIRDLILNDPCLILLCYEQPAELWRDVLKQKHLICYDEYSPDKWIKPTKRTTIIIDSVNQMALFHGWNECLNFIKSLEFDSNITKLILILHKDCLLLNTKLQIHLNHMAHSIVSYDAKQLDKIHVQIKKAGKVVKSEEVLSWDVDNEILKATTVVTQLKNIDVVENVSPASLTTFKIETDQIAQMERNKFQLPYMSKINEGQGRVFYEPDAVDDWDDEDPDDDLEI